MANVTNLELFEALRSLVGGKGHGKGHGKGGHGKHHHGEHGEHGHGAHHHGEGHVHGGPGCGCKARRAAAGETVVAQGTEGKGGKCRKGRESSRNRILVALLNQPEGAKQKDLVEVVGIQPASVSEQVDILAAHGYVTKTVDDADKRVTIISLTEKGQVKAEEAKQEQDSKLEELFQDLSVEEKDQLFELLNKIKK